MKRRWLALTGIFIGMGSSAMMQTYLSVSMPSIADELGGMTLYHWVFGAYMLASTVTIPLFAKLADLFGRRRVYLTGLVLFAAGVVFCGLSASMPMLVFCRALMGMGAGAITPSALGLMGDMFEEKDFTRVFGFMGVVQVLSNLLGPLLGGFLSTALSWRWGFILFLPLVLACALLVCFNSPVGLPEKPSDGSHQISSSMNELDWKGALLLSAGLTGTILGLQLISRDEIIQGICFVLTSGFLLWLSLRLEKTCKDPVLPISLLFHPAIRNGMIAVFLLGILHNSASTYLSLYYQNVLGKNAATAGVYLLPMLVSAGIASALCGKFTKRVQQRTSLVLWMLTGLSFIGITWLGNQLDGLAGVFLSIPIGLGLGFMLPLYLGGSQIHADKTNRAVSGGMVQLSRNLGGTIGVSLLGILISGPLPVRTGLKGIFLCLAIVSLSAFIFSYASSKSMRFGGKRGRSGHDPMV